MPSRIEALPLDVVHLIAAGEVIDSLAAVIRELAENSLDAGATRIAISVYPEQWRVRVADNGSGMGLEDLQQAAAPHSTSKIRHSGDLSQIRSLGFRGEALHSLAQLAELEILSRVADSNEGWWAAYDAHGAVTRLEPAAIAPGTVVIADQIFGRWSTRREGLPAVNQQLKAIQVVIQHLALCHPYVTWQVQQNDREWFHLWLGKTSRQILPQILRDVQVDDLQELQVGVAIGATREPGTGDEVQAIQKPGARIQPAEEMEDETVPCPASPAWLYLLLGLPDRCHRHRPDWVKVALNGRFVHLPELEQTILAGFRRTLPRDRFPVCFVHLSVPPHQVDWNRHPAKTEVYLHHLGTWQKQVSLAIEQALQMGPINLTDTLYSDRVGKLLKATEAENGYRVDSNRPMNSAGQAKLIAPQTPHPTVHNPVRAIAQLHNMYILAEHPTGVWLIEQHIAHERVLYERLCDRWQIVPLPSPIVLNQLSLAQVEQLQRLGLEVEPFGVQAWVVRSIPGMLVSRDDCNDALLELSLGGDLQTAQVAIACRSAIRNGTPLTIQDMQELLDQWQQTRNPRTCPHGRPICLTLAESSLSRFFRRHWVIGKSHGI